MPTANGHNISALNNYWLVGFGENLLSAFAVGTSFHGSTAVMGKRHSGQQSWVGEIALHTFAKLMRCMAEQGTFKPDNNNNIKQKKNELSLSSNESHPLLVKIYVKL